MVTDYTDAPPMDVSTPPGDSTTGGPRLTPELLLTPTMVGEGSAVGVMTSMDATTLMTPAMECTSAELAASRLSPHTHMAARNHQTSTDLAVRHQSAAAFFSDFACCGRRLESLHDLLEHYETQHVRVAGAAGVGSHFGNAVKSSGDVSHLGNASTATSCAPTVTPLFRTERADSISSSHSGASNSSSTSELHPRPIFHFQNARTETPLTVGDYTKLSPNAAQAHATAMQAAATQAAQITQAALLAQQQHPTTTQLRGVAGATLANTTAQIGKRALQQSMRGSTNVTPNTPVDTVYVQEEHTTTMSNEPDASARSAFDTTTVLRAMARAQHDDAVAGSPAYYDPHAQERGLVDGLRYTQDGMSAAIDDAHASQTHSYPRQHMTAYFPPTPAPYTVMTVTPASLVCTDDEDRVEPGSLDAEDSYRRYLKALRKQERLSMAGPGYEDAADRRHPCMVVGCNKAYRNMNGLKYHLVHSHTEDEQRQAEESRQTIPEEPVYKPYICDMCDRAYKNPNGLKYHFIHHHSMSGGDAAKAVKIISHQLSSRRRKSEVQ